MPQDKLQQLLMNRPVQISGEVQYPTEGVNNLGAKALDALGVGLGINEQRPGNAADAIGGALGAVSVIIPKIARLLGAAKISELKEAGRLKIPGVAADASVPLSQDYIDALEFAQKRWPRIFGHIDDIRYVNPIINPDTVRGVAAGSRIGKTGYTSNMEIAPDRSPTRGDAFNTVGHELMHVADNIRGPRYTDIRRTALDLPHGYTGASHEVRARIQGAKTQAYGMGLGRKDIDAYAINNNTYYPDGGSKVKSSEGFDIIRPIDSRISGLPPEALMQTSKPVETNEQKLLRLINERMDRKQQGLPKDPRVPNPYKK